MNTLCNDSSNSESDSDYNEKKEEEIIRNFEIESKLIINNLLPKKSCEVYENVYATFMKWHEQNKATSFSEKILIVYFNELLKKYKPTTLWAKWSMLRTTLNIKEGVDISTYNNLKTFLKNHAKGYKPRKANPFTLTQIKTFFEKANNHLYLGVKVITVFGICGALRCDEFTHINTTDIEHTNTQCIVTIKDSKTTYPRTFVIGPPWYDMVKQYAALRPADMTTNRFFIVYQKGKCHRQVIGKNKFSETPNTIAQYLNLPNPENYTGHSFRRSGATLLSNSGANLVAVKSLGGWKSDAVAQGYIDNSLKMKNKIFEDITGFVAPSITSTTGTLNTLAFDKPSNIRVPPVLDTSKPSTSKEYASPVDKESIDSSNSPKEILPRQSNGLNIDESDKENHNSNKNDSIDNINNINNNTLPKKRKLSKTTSNLCENKIQDEIDLNSRYVVFQNCQINNLNNYSCSVLNNNYSCNCTKEKESLCKH